MSAGYESKEYERLVKRGFKPYSSGHRFMYDSAIAQIGEVAGPRGARVLEAGFGIGWGLERMLEADVLKSYVGCEPNADSFRYVAEKLKDHERAADLHLLFQKFEGFTPARVGYIFDFAFCIEVIEHVPMDDHVRFLRDLRRLSPVLFFSTPDKNKVPAEGVRTVSDWTRVIREAGFTDVSVDMSRWTYLYRCKT